jgi:photosystem II stability/assembly factor-like uncharacterized protein
MKKITFFLISFLLAATFLVSEDNADFTSKDISHLNPRLIGPAVTSGRVIDIAVHPADKRTWYVGVASGGVWKTTNAGHTFTPIFDQQSSYSIGCVAIDPNNPNVIWVGSGENNSQRSVGYGDGVYKSVDGGASWKNVGLENSEHIGKVIIDPRNSDRVMVAAQGPLWSAGGDRGLYITEDGGETWTKTLDISENTGISDIVVDRRNPDVVYASSYQRRRRQWTLINGGPEGAIYKSTDGGKNWDKLSSGLPSGNVGRIGLAIGNNNPDIVYAIIEAENGGGFYRSTNSGASWSKMSGKVSGSPQYYQEIFTDPNNDDRIYCMDTYTSYSEDAGRTWNRINTSHKHVDDHALWIDPDDSTHMLIGNDGGVYETFDQGQNWRHFENIPTVQFYKIAVDNAEPFYNVYGGTQDNNTLGGPSQTKNPHGILNQHWKYVRSGDGFKPVVDPKDPNTVYAQAQYASIGRVNMASGESVGIKPQADKGEALKWNWSSPILISPHDNNTLYYASQKVFKSNDRGSSWEKISEDLTKGIDRNTLPVMGKVWGPEAVAKNASTSFYGSIVSLDESPISKGLLYAGTDDGTIQVTTDDGKNWTKYVKFPGVPDDSYVSDLQPSLHNANTVFATFDNHKSGDFKPYVLKSQDQGKTWKSITGNLPEKGTVYAIEQDHENPDILFAGTEFGAFVTIDGGKEWAEITGGGFPTVAVYDIELQRRENDIVLGTFGRGIYVVDDYSSLREMKDMDDNKSRIFQVSDGEFYLTGEGQGQGWAGATFFKADNPEIGTEIHYYISDVPKSLSEKRAEEENSWEETKQPYKYPTWEQLRAEDLEQGSFAILTIRDMDNSVVRRLTAPAKEGMGSVHWDLRYTDLTSLSEKTSVNDQSSMPVFPGEYTVSLSLVSSEGIKDIAGPVSFDVKPLDGNIFTGGDLAESISFRRELADLYSSIRGSSSYLNKMEENLTIMEKAVLLSPSSDVKDLSKINSMKMEIEQIGEILFGNETIQKRNGLQPPSVNERMGNMLYALWYSTGQPQGDHKKTFDIMKDEYQQAHNMMKKLDRDFTELSERTASSSGAWLPGMLPSSIDD